MKTGKSLTEMAAELERREEMKRDVVADTRQIILSPVASDSGTDVRMTVEGIEGMAGMPITKHAHGQIATKLGIPMKHYSRLLKDHPDLIANEATQLMHREPERRMIRTLDGTARALMSDRYRPLDNYDLANAVLPILQEQEELQIVSTDITETRFYLKAVFPRISGEVQVNDIVQSGVVISNSEVGAGALSVQPLIYRLWCLNGCTTDIGGQRRTHVGKRAADNESAYELYRDETLAADDHAFWLKVQDTVRGLSNEAGFAMILNKMQESLANKITGDPVAAVEVTRKRFGYSEELGGSILRHLVEDAAKNGLSQFGISNAITRASQDVDDYDLASQLERDGGKIIELPKNQWEEIALAA